MKKQVYFDKLIKSTLNSESAHIDNSPDILDKIHLKIREENKGDRIYYSRSWPKRVAVAICMALLITASTIAVSPKARAYAAKIPQAFGIMIITIAGEDDINIKGETIDVDQLQPGEVKEINGLTIQKAEQKVDVNSEPNAILERHENGVQIDSRVDSFKITEDFKKELAKNSNSIDISKLEDEEEIDAGGLKIQKSKK